MTRTLDLRIKSPGAVKANPSSLLLSTSLMDRIRWPGRTTRTAVALLKLPLRTAQLDRQQRVDYGSSPVDWTGRSPVHGELPRRAWRPLSRFDYGAPFMTIVAYRLSGHEPPRSIGAASPAASPVAAARSDTRRRGCHFCQAQAVQSVLAFSRRTG